MISNKLKQYVCPFLIFLIYFYISLGVDPGTSAKGNFMYVWL